MIAEISNNDRMSIIYQLICKFTDSGWKNHERFKFIELSDKHELTFFRQGHKATTIVEFNGQFIKTFKLLVIDDNSGIERVSLTITVENLESLEVILPAINHYI